MRLLFGIWVWAVAWAVGVAQVPAGALTAHFTTPVSGPVWVRQMGWQSGLWDTLCVAHLTNAPVAELTIPTPAARMVQVFTPSHNFWVYIVPGQSLTCKLNPETGAFDPAFGTGLGLAPTLAYAQYVRELKNCPLPNFSPAELRAYNPELFYSRTKSYIECINQIYRLTIQNNTTGSEAFNGLSNQERNYRLGYYFLNQLYTHGRALTDSTWQNWGPQWLEQQLDTLLGNAPRYDAQLVVNSTDYRYFLEEYLNVLFMFRLKTMPNLDASPTSVAAVSAYYEYIATLPITPEMEAYLLMRKGYAYAARRNANALEMLINRLAARWPAAPQLAGMRLRLIMLR